MRTHEEIKNNRKLMFAKGSNDIGYVTLESGRRGTFVYGRNEGGWEHISVCFPKRLPSWEEMCEIKDIFWDEEELVIQMHPRKSEYVNIAEALHLWRPAASDWSLLNYGEHFEDMDGNN